MEVVTLTSVLTKDTVLKKLHKQADWNKQATPVAVVLLLCVGIFLLWTGATRTVEKALAIALCLIGAILLALSMLMVIGYVKMLKSYRNEEHLKFWLTRDVCVSKKHTTISTDSGQDAERYYLYFATYGKYQIDAQSVISHDDSDHSKCIELYIDELFQNTNEGDEFYLLFTEESTPYVCIALPSYEWELPAEHTVIEGKIYLN